MRTAFRLLPLPFCIALSLAAHAEDRHEDWGLCPIENAVPAFADAQPPSGDGESRAGQSTEIDGDSAQGIDGETMSVEGNVVLRRGDQFLGTDKLDYDQETEKYVAEGSVRYQDSRMRLVARHAEGDQANDKHRIEDVQYQLTSRRGNGGAERIELDGTVGSLFGSTYSTCPPSDRRWELRAQRIDVDTDKGMGTARNATLHIGKVPVLYVPWFRFPIDDRRRTGLLYPVISSSGRNGFDWRQPIYLNLAPAYDATLTPRYMSKRGLQLGGEFRYLNANGRGTFEGAFLPSDELTDREHDEEILEVPIAANRREDDRGFFRFNGHQGLGSKWQARSNLMWISDTRYLEDSSNSLNGVSASSVYSDMGLYGHGRSWSAGVMADYWQLADYTLRETSLPYNRLPRLYAQWEQPFSRWFTAGLDAEAVRFAHIDELDQYVDGTTPVTIERAGGTRVDVRPYVSMPLEGASWFLKPTLAWRYTSYKLDDSVLDPSRNSSPSRSLPITTVDAGLFFDRNTSFGGEPYLNTLEPRLFYVNAPYRDQDDIPLFDTQPLTFGWGQLFRDNRFSGADRQSDANQLTLAVTSRLIRESDGREKLSASFGQIRYFDDSLVRLSPTDPIVERGRSAWIADVNYAVNDRWTMGATYQWDPKIREKDLASFRTRYLVGDDGIVNFSYRYRRDLLEQVDLSFLYPITPVWSVVGRYYYSLQDHQLLEAIAGVQWDSCCLAARLVGRRYLRNREGELNSAIQLEIELKGLGSAGPDTESRLRRSILGYYRDDLYLVPPPETRSGDDTPATGPAP